MNGDLGRRRGGGDGEGEDSAGVPNGTQSPTARRYATPLGRAIQRKQGDGDAAPTIHDAATAAVDHKGSGAAVDAGVADKVGSYLGADLSGVRVHGDPLSREATAAMGARAFAYGGDVFLGPGESGGDLGLMAHELTHVVQQGAAGQRAPQRRVQVGASDSPAERQADAVSAAVTGGQPGAAASGALIVDELPVQPGQMLKSQFIAQLHGQVMAAAQEELGPIWSVMGCPYIEQTFARYSGQPAAASETLLKRFAPAAAQARTAADLIAPVVARVREGVRNWRETGQPPADVAAVDPRAAAGATDTPPREQEQRMQQGGGPGAAAAESAAPAAHAKRAEPGSPADVVATLGDGARLDGATAARMEGAFGQSFADVRIHTDATAARLADDHDAHAFTIGSHVAFGANTYRPGAPEGDALVAHELAHVVQQQGAGPVEQAVQRKPIEDGGAEAHADQAAHGVMAQLWGGVKGAARKVTDGLKTDVGMKRCSKTSAPLPSGSLTSSGSIAHTSGAQLDTYVSGTAAISGYLSSTIAAGRVATGHVHFFNAADFRTRCVAYLVGKTNPNTGGAFTQAEAEAFEPGVNAYQDGADVYVHQDRGTPSTVIHEGMHLYESDTFTAVGFNISEGATEWLTRLVIADRSLGFVRNNYQSQYNSLTKLAAKGGQGALMAAYFNGNIAGLRTAVDAATSAGTYDRWVTFMNASNYASADALM
jgi:Domain of unknown function (DUF4157)